MSDPALPRYELLAGSQSFWERASADVAAARDRVLIQAMTFEGDSAGLGVATAIAVCAAADRRVLVDDYTRHVINDTFLALSRDPDLHAEAQATWAMFDRMVAAGVGLRITNPVGPLPLRYATRNHKKLLVMDKVAWIGGINFSEHNFAWHDMMVRIEHAGIADWLAAQFDADWTGRTASVSQTVGGVDLISADGNANERVFAGLLDSFASARRSIEVISAYPTFPFVEAMAHAAGRGVAVTLYTPRPNNKPVIRDYLLGVADRSGLALRLMPDMTHVKAALIDGEALTIGSCNFDFVSHRANAEYVATVHDRGLIAQFEDLILEPARRAATSPGSEDYSGWRSLKARIGLRAADAVVRRLNHGPRVADWGGAGQALRRVE